MEFKMEFEKLIFRTLEDPKSISLLEKKVDELVQSNDIELLRSLSSTENPTVKLYLSKVLELRIKRKVESATNAFEEISLISDLMLYNYSYHVGSVYSLTGMFYWPKLFPNFFDNLWQNGLDEKSCEILLLFFKKVNTSTEIDEKRRAELKTAIRALSRELLASLDAKYAYYVIQIYTELLRMIPLDYDYSLVFEKAGEHTQEAIEFFVEAGSEIDTGRMIDVLERLPSNSAMVVLLCGTKLRNETEIEKACEYVYRNLKTNPASFSFVLDFFTKINWSGREALLAIVLGKTLETYLSLDEIEREESCGAVNGLFTAMARGCCTGCVDFLLRHEEGIPEKLASGFLQKANKMATPGLLSGVCFNSVYLNCFNACLHNNPHAVAIIDSLDLTNKEHAKLVNKVIQIFPVDEGRLRRLLHAARNGCLAALEVYVECALRLSEPPVNFTNFNGAAAIEFYYFLKKDRQNYLRYSNDFFVFFMQTPFFDRCFAILKMLGNTVEQQESMSVQHTSDSSKNYGALSNSQTIDADAALKNKPRTITTLPEIVLRNIYEKLEKSPYIEIACFNNDLLCYLPIYVQKPFFCAEVARFVAEWNCIDDHRPYYHAVKSLLTVFAMHLNNTELVDLMLELLVIDFSVIVSKIVNIIMAVNCQFNTSKAVYYLFSCFISSNLYEVHPQVVNALTFCMAQPDGPYAFAYVLKFDQEACKEVRDKMNNVNRKIAQNIMRKFIASFRGKPLRNLFENSVKVTKQNFLSKKAPAEDIERPSFDL